RKYRERQLQLSAEYYWRKKAAGIPAGAPVSQAGMDRVLYRQIERMSQPEAQTRQCTRIVGRMFKGLPHSARYPQRKPNRRDAANRARDRAKAIAALGGCCEHCRYNDARALEIAHKQPPRRRLNGLRKNALASDATYRAVLSGKAADYELLCSNC